jgi:hypothetical protein
MKTRIVLAVLFVTGLITVNADAWWIKGHGLIAEAACSRLPDEMPAFFRAAGKQLNHLAGDPDRWKNPETKHLRAAESPDHYIDLEDYDNNELPPDRYKAASLIAKIHRSPEKAGMLPYALAENVERLTVAFRDYRDVRDREKRLELDGNETALKAVAAERQAIEMKCIVYAGALSHFTGDAAMPLHTTRDYDGRKGADGMFVQKGIHAKIDGFPETYGFTAEEIGRGVEPKEIDDVWKRIEATIKESYQHINRCYEIDKEGGFEKPTEASRVFIMQRCQVAAQFTADMWYTAWKKSAKLPASLQ